MIIFRSRSILFSVPKAHPMLTIDLNVVTLLTIIVLSILTGFLGRSRQLARKNQEILQLEDEMIQAHAELLESQREYCKIEAAIKGLSIPVISMKHASKDEQPVQEQRAENKSRGTNQPRTAS